MNYSVKDKKIIENILKDIFKKLQEETEYYQDEKTYDTPNLKVAAEIEGAIESESDAIEIYLKLLEVITDKGDIKIVQEIISDEENHREKLLAMVKKYNKIPPSKD
jgi:rubrerythrin